MVFVRNWGAEQGKDAIAQRLRDVTLITMHGIHHELQSWVNDRSCFFGIKSFNQGG